MSSNESLRIAIIGGGIGGLTLAAALGSIGRTANFDVQIYEQSPVIAEVGAGMNFWPRSWHIMKAMGLQDKLVDLLSEPPDESFHTFFHVRKGDQPDGSHIKDMHMKGGAVRFHRAELLDVLHERALGKIHLNHRFVSYEETADEVILHFENGVTAKCDVLIGVDGIRSAVRRQFLDKTGQTNSPCYEPYWSGAYAYRGLIPVEQLNENFPEHKARDEAIMYCGKAKHVVTYKISNNKLLNVVAIVSNHSMEGTPLTGPTSEQVDQKEMLSAFEGWEPGVTALLQSIKQPTRYALQALRPMERYSKGRIILLGDAVHGMTPHQGAGAGTAVEDAFILSSLLAHRLCTKSAIPTVSEIYNTIRRPAGNRAQYTSWVNGRLCQLSAPGFEDVVEGTILPKERLDSLVDAISKNWEWCWKETAEDDRQRAIAMLTAAASRGDHRAHL